MKASRSGVAVGEALSVGSAPRAARGPPAKLPTNAMSSAAPSAIRIGGDAGRAERWAAGRSWHGSLRSGAGPEHGRGAHHAAMTGWDHTRRTRTAHRGYAVAMRLRCYLGHGASGTSASMAPFVSGLRARGVTATAIDLPKRKAEDALPAFHLVVPSAADVAVGGHSYRRPRRQPRRRGTGCALRRARPVQLPAPSARRPGADRGPDRPLAGHPLPGPAAVGRVGSVRQHRPPACVRGEAPARGAGHLSPARAHPQAGPRGRPRPHRGVPARGRRRTEADASSVRAQYEFALVSIGIGPYPDRPPSARDTCREAKQPPRRRTDAHGCRPPSV